MLDKLDKSTSNKLGHVKQMLESLTSDRTDDRVIREGIERMRQHVIDRKRIVRVADELPWAIRVAIYRLVNKFGKRSVLFLAINFRLPFIWSFDFVKYLLIIHCE
jgi:hypothetical protein